MKRILENKKIILIVFMFIIFLFIGMSKSLATTVKYSQLGYTPSGFNANTVVTMEGLRKIAEAGKLFDIKLELLNGETIQRGNNSADNKYTACLGHGNTDTGNATGGNFVISAIIAMDTNYVHSLDSNKFKGRPGAVYGYNGTLKRAQSATIAKEMAKIAYIAQSAQGETLYNSKYKSIMGYYVKSNIASMDANFDLDRALLGSPWDNYSAPTDTDYINAVNDYSEKVAKYRFKEVEISKDATANTKSLEINGSDTATTLTYVGPYKINTVGGTITAVSLTGHTFKGYATSLYGTSVETDKTKLPNNTKIWLVFNGTVTADQAKSGITIKKSFDGVQFVEIYGLNASSANNSQHEGIFAAKGFTRTDEITLGIEELDTESFYIQKTASNDPNLKMKGIMFEVKGPDGSGIKEYLTTDSEGKTETLEDLPKGTYKIKEYNHSSYVNADGRLKNYKGYIISNEEKTVTLGTGTTQKVTFTNQYQLGSINIKKQDTNTGGALKNVGFTIRMTSGLEAWNYVYKDSNGNALYSSTPQTVYTDGYGKIDIEKMWPGDYILTEVYNENPGYLKIPRESAPIVIASGTVDNSGKIEVARATNVIVRNQRIYVDLEGYVWSDIIPGVKDEIFNRADDVYTPNSSDRLVKGVPVYLMSGTSVVAETKTDKDGKYKFSQIKLDNIDTYYVQFRYNGMAYTTVGYKNQANGSKGVEIGREGFDNQFATIVNSYAINTDGQKSYDLEYTKDKQTSKFNFGNGENTLESDGGYTYGYKEANYPVYSNKGQYNLTANTKDSPYNGLDIYKKAYILANGIATIPNINLGLTERAQPDIRLANDIDAASISLNNYTHIYKYPSTRTQEYTNDKNNAEYKNSYFNVGVSFQNKKNDDAFTQTVYSSDWRYNEQNDGTLNVDLVYKVTIYNESSLCSRVHNINMYFDERYAIQEVTTGQIGEDGKLTGTPLNYSVDNKAGSGLVESQYSKTTITTSDLNLEGYGNKTIYVRFKLKPEAVRKIASGELTLNTLVEVKSYSTFNNNTYSKARSGIDIDSAPENVGVLKHKSQAIKVKGEDKIRQVLDNSEFEDDTNAAPVISLALKPDREIRGTVWEDKEIAELLAQENERVGNGILEEAENKVDQVRVELIDKDGETVNLYSNSGTKEAICQTNTKGEYKFEGVMPGEYKVKFTYGDACNTYNGNGDKAGEVKAENYKSTIFRREKTYRNPAINSNMAVSIVASEDDKWYIRDREIGKKYSDAYDNITLVQSRNGSSNNEYIYADYSTGITEIEASTESLKIDMDSDAMALNSNISQVNRNLVYIFDEIDFGIIQRPHQDIQVKKEISNIKLTSAYARDLINGDPRSGNLDYVKNLPRIVLAEMDSESLQGSTLKLTYDITVENKCENDYYRDLGSGWVYNYYYTGDKTGNELFYANVKELVDYLPNGLSYDEEKNKENGWEIIEASDLYNSSDVTNNKVKDEVYDVIKDNTLILETEVFDGLQIRESRTAKLLLTKNISSKDEEMSFDNYIEIIKLSGLKARSSIPGNYVPNDIGSANPEHEPDDDAIQFVITPPTGEDKDYTIYIIIAVTTLSVLGMGIIIIKKTVLK